MPTRLHKLTSLEESDDIFGLQPEGILASATSRPRPSPATEVQLFVENKRPIWPARAAHKQLIGRSLPSLGQLRHALALRRHASGLQRSSWPKAEPAYFVSTCRSNLG